MLKVCIAISTYGMRIDSISLPLPVIGVSYLIIHQKPNEGNFFLRNREDVTYIPTDSIGISSSRNLGIENNKSDYLYFMDDDTIIYPEGIVHICQLMRTDAVDVATCMFKYMNGSSKSYRKNAFDHNIYSLAKVSSIEICVNSKTTREVFFNQSFGLGAEYPSGEEYIYLATLLRAGKKIRFYPIATSTHPDVTSGQDFYSTKNKILAKKVMIEKVFPNTHLLVKTIFFLKKLPDLFVSKSIFKFFKGFFL